jgi:hypothetical protein
VGTGGAGGVIEGRETQSRRQEYLGRVRMIVVRRESARRPSE